MYNPGGFEHMNITLILNVSQIVVAILLILAILLQARGTGLGSAFGGEGNIFRTKRGVEKILFYATIVLGILFVGISLAGLII
jgi:preprotein translocase subunit SecG